nr:hypothetical protein CFP56_11218 [Quercus suber]
MWTDQDPAASKEIKAAVGDVVQNGLGHDRETDLARMWLGGGEGGMEESYAIGDCALTQEQCRFCLTAYVGEGFHLCTASCTFPNADLSLHEHTLSTGADDGLNKPSDGSGHNQNTMLSRVKGLGEHTSPAPGSLSVSGAAVVVNLSVLQSGCGVGWELVVAVEGGDQLLRFAAPFQRKHARKCISATSSPPFK